MLVYYPFYSYQEDVEEMILRRLEDRIWHEERKDGLWPATFCLGEWLWAGALRAYEWARKMSLPGG